MNFRDMATLKWKQIVKDRVVYTRLKTGKMVEFKLMSPALEMLEKYKKPISVQADDFVFPILSKNEHTTPQQISNWINRVLRQVNASLKELAQQVKAPVHLTTYAAHHTYATILKQSGISQRFNLNKNPSSEGKVVRQFFDTSKYFRLLSVPIIGDNGTKVLLDKLRCF
jgi:integrase